MRRVRRTGTSPEVRLRQALWAAGLRYRKNLRVAGAPPDLVFVGAKVAVFVDGCFWHGCPVHYKPPVRNAGFWRERLRKNQERDARDTLRLQAAGWTVLRFWECEVKKELAKVVADVSDALA